MSVLQFLQQRQSTGKLIAPAPTAQQWHDIMRVALRAPDHARLKPYRFLLIEGQAREKLGRLFVDVAKADGETNEDKLAKLAANPFRAPLIAVVIVRAVVNAKVPFSEQQLSAGCAAHGLLLAANAMGFGAMWRTGDMAYHPAVHNGLGLSANENMIGFLYIGTPAMSIEKPLEEVAPELFFTHWQ